MRMDIETLRLGPGRFKVLQDSFVSPYSAEIIKVDGDKVEVKLFGDPNSRSEIARKKNIETKLMSKKEPSRKQEVEVEIVDPHAHMSKITCM